MRKTALSVLGWLLSAGLRRPRPRPSWTRRPSGPFSTSSPGDRAFETLRITTQWHKPSASEGFFAVARVHRGAGESRRPPGRPLDRPGRRVARLDLPAGGGHADRGRGRRTRARRGSGRTPRSPTSIADYSRPADVTAELVDVGAGDRAADYAGRDVRGKIVLAYGSPSAVMEQAVWKRGAAGILSWASSRLNPLADSADQVAWIGVPEKDGPNGAKTTWAFVLSARDGKGAVRPAAGRARRAGSTSAKAPADAPLRAARRGRVRRSAEKKTAMVEARIPGTDPSLPEIVLTAHLQENISANDDQSGVASILEIGRALTRLIAEGRLPRPRRGIRFWWATRSTPSTATSPTIPGEEKKVLANLNQDMVGAKQSLGRPRAVHGAHAVVDALVPQRRPGEHPRHGRRRQQRVPRRPGRPDSIPPGRPVLEADLLAPRDPGALPRAGRPLLRQHRPPRLRRRLGRRARDVPDELAGRVHPLVRSTTSGRSTPRSSSATPSSWPRRPGGWRTPDAEDVEPLGAFVAARGVERLGRDLATALTWLRDGKGSPEERYRAAVGPARRSRSRRSRPRSCFGAARSVRSRRRRRRPVPGRASGVAGRARTRAAGRARPGLRRRERRRDAAVRTGPGARAPGGADAPVRRHDARRLDGAEEAGRGQARRRSAGRARTRRSERRPPPRRERARPARSRKPPVAAPTSRRRCRRSWADATMNWVDGKTQRRRNRPPRLRRGALGGLVVLRRDDAGAASRRSWRSRSRTGCSPGDGRVTSSGPRPSTTRCWPCFQCPAIQAAWGRGGCVQRPAPRRTRSVPAVVAAAPRRSPRPAPRRRTRPPAAAGRP